MPGNLLFSKVQAIWERSSPCILCPRQCRTQRIIGELGFCMTGINPHIASYGPHFGEERPISGTRGSGTIFFTGCTMECRFCQNYEISHERVGHEISEKELSNIFLHLQNQGCHNINLVTPTHQLPAIIKALLIAKDAGLRIPVVYNTNGYENPDTLRLLEGIIDIYMPDFKFAYDETGKTLSNTPDYPGICKESIHEMYRQVGDLTLKNGIATRGLLIRHLVMPGGTEESERIIRFIAEQISQNTWLNIMDQYRPAGEIRRTCPDGYSYLLRQVSEKELSHVYRIAEEYGLTRGLEY
ncbi:radical SAM protein [Methanospirillum sp.]|uniref:radical SAM protein n=1 Tax=Methanospirillum sp. TaxID=45200 RepID=UPI0035A1B5E4